MAEFVEKISDPLLLNLFLMDLVDDDTTRSMYADFYASDKGNAPLTTAGKVDRVCRLVRQALDRLSIDEQRRRLTAILTTYAKLSRPEVDCALLRMKQVAALVESCDAATLIDEALRYLLYIVDAETLFNMALATYDLDLVLMVAERSQKDPKEYLPLLNKLRRMDASYMKYTIEMHLERFATALLHIEQCSEDHFPEAVDLIKKHQLFRESLQVFAKSDKYQTICSMYADHCNQKRQYAEAALLFQNAGELNKAFEAYCDGLLWRELIALAKQIGIDQARLTETLKHVATKLESHKRFEEAAEIYEHHLLAINSAVTSYCAAGAWAKALCATANSGQSELIEAIILPALKQRADQMTESAQRWTTELRTHCERLQIVRANKSNRLLTWVESGEADFAESEVYSEASTAISSTSTTSSMRSGQSMSSSRRPRRGHMERKKASMKEGSKYEDLARMGVVRQIIVDIDAAQDELGPLLTTLVRLRMNELGGKVQQEFCTLITYARSLLTDVWPAFWQAHLLPGPLEELYKGPDGIIRFPTAGAMPDRLAIEPQMIPPTIRSVFWELDMLRQL
uniref:Uncharacterized protein n=1 Tax=Plectus sambesii TaxID=2011161 RepID=A0A914XCB4_9BILA